MLSNGLQAKTTSDAWSMYPNETNPVNSQQVGTIWVNTSGELQYTDLTGIDYNISNPDPITSESTLQEVYDNSTPAEIVTNNAPNGTFIIRDGSGVNNEDIIDIQNNLNESMFKVQNNTFTTMQNVLCDWLESSTLNGTFIKSSQDLSTINFNINNNDNAFALGFRSSLIAPPATVRWRLPQTDGLNGQVLTTDGNENLSWVDNTGGGGGGGDLYNVLLVSTGTIPPNVILSRYNDQTVDMGIAVPSTGTTKLVSFGANLGQSSTTANTDLIFNIREFPAESGTAYSSGQGSLLHTETWNSGSSLPSLYYRSYESAGLDITCTPGTFIFVEASLNFWSVIEMTVGLGFTYTAP